VTEGLPLVAIADVTLAVDAWNPLAAQAQVPFEYIDISSIDPIAKEIRETERLLPKDAPSRARQLIRVGDVLVSTVRPNLNAVAMVPRELDCATASTGFAVLRPDTRLVNGRYLFHWVTCELFVREMVKRATGASYPAVSNSAVREFKLPLPPLKQQINIAKTLDMANSVWRKRREAEVLPERLLYSTFEDLFGDPVSNPMGWPKARLMELVVDKHAIVDGPFGSSLKPESYVSRGVRVIRNFNIRDDDFDASAFKYVTPEKFAQIRRSEVLLGDVLLSTKGTVGNVCRMPELEGRSVLSASGTVRIRVPPGAPVRPEFVVAQMIDPSFKRHIKQQQSGTIQKYLNLTTVKALELVVPPLPLQDRYCELASIVRRVRGRVRTATVAAAGLIASVRRHVLGIAA